MREIYIAVVDDISSRNKETVKLLEKINQLDEFEGVRFAIREYESGLKLLDSEHTYELIIMDYDMPGMNGIETAEELVRRGAQSKVIFLSGYGNIVEPLQQSASVDLTAGFVLKNDLFEEFKHQVTSVLKGILDVYFIEIEYYEEVEILDTGEYTREFYQTFVDAKKIVSVETRNKMAFVYLENGEEFLTVTPLKTWLLKLPSGDFSYSKKSCLVNLKYVKFLSRRKIHLTNANFIGLTDFYTASFKKSLSSYRMREAMR